MHCFMDLKGQRCTCIAAPILIFKLHVTVHCVIYVIILFMFVFLFFRFVFYFVCSVFFVLFSVLCLLFYIDLSFLFLYKLIDHCDRV